MREQILFVDDDVRILEAFKRRHFRTYDMHLADSAEKALELLREGKKFAVIVSDQQMPGMKGIDFLKEVKTLSPLSVRIMLTGNADRETAVSSVNESNVFRYLTKPCSAEEFSGAIDDGIAHYRLALAERDLLEHTLAGSAKLLIDILAVTDPHTFKEVSSLRRMGKRLAKVIKHPKIWELDMTIMLSSIGEVMLPPEVRTKLSAGETLGKLEQQMVAGTPKIARDLLLNIPRLNLVAEAIYYKNKNYDGSGYPMDKINGNEIPLDARILRILTLIAENSDGGVPKAETFEAIRQMRNVVDPRLLALAEKCFVHGAAEDENERVDVAVTIDNLLPGDRLLADLVTGSGKLALHSDRELTDALIHKVRQFHTLRPLKEPVKVSRLISSASGKAAVA